MKHKGTTIMKLQQNGPSTKRDQPAIEYQWAANDAKKRTLHLPTLLPQHPLRHSIALIHSVRTSQAYSYEQVSPQPLQQLLAYLVVTEKQVKREAICIPDAKLVSV